MNRELNGTFYKVGSFEVGPFVVCSFVMGPCVNGSLCDWVLLFRVVM